MSEAIRFIQQDDGWAAVVALPEVTKIGAGKRWIARAESGFVEVTRYPDGVAVLRRGDMVWSAAGAGDTAAELLACLLWAQRQDADQNDPTPRSGDS